MGYEATTFERSALYVEVWTEPMTTVAKRYAISDVGLRKICVKLDIPVPPRGYWARVAAGQVIKKTLLPKSDVVTTLERLVHVSPDAVELKRRISKARASEIPIPAAMQLDYPQPSDISMLGREAVQIAKLITNLKRPGGILEFSERAWAELSISESMESRALYLLDRLGFSIRAVGGVFELKKIPPERSPYVNGIKQPPYDRGYFRIHGSDYFIRVKERIHTEEVIDPPKPRPKAARWEPDWEALTRKKKYLYTPTGKLTLAVFSASGRYEIAKIEDADTKPVEEKILGFAQRLEVRSLKSKVEAELRHQRELERQRKVEVWEEQKAIKAALLKRLESFELMARNLDRSESLRRLARKIGDSTIVDPSLTIELALIEKMADWIDPLVQQRWPEIDDVPDRNPHSYW